MIDAHAENLTIESRAREEFASWMNVEALAADGVTTTRKSSPSRIALDPDDVKRGLGRIVLTVVELVRELLERQALRRIEAESLTAEEIERLGTTFLQLSQQMERLKQEFGVGDEDLNIDLGPLGKLL